MSQNRLTKESKSNSIFVKNLLLLLIGILLLPSSSWAKNDLYDYLKTIGGDFTLTNHFGEKTSLKDYQGKTVLLFFGYLNCPDVCPTALIGIKMALRQLKDEERKKTQVLFITVDPDRDDSQFMKEYLEAFDSSFIGLRGSTEEIAKVGKQYNIRYFKEQIKSENEYNVAHSSTLFMIGDKGKVKDLFSHPANQTYLAKRLREELNNKRKSQPSPLLERLKNFF